MKYLKGLGFEKQKTISGESVIKYSDKPSYINGNDFIRVCGILNTTNLEMVKNTISEIISSSNKTPKISDTMKVYSIGGSAIPNEQIKECLNYFNISLEDISSTLRFEFVVHKQ